MALQSEVGAFGDIAYRGDELVIARSLLGSVITNDWTVDTSEFEYLMFLNIGIEPITGRIFACGKAHNSGRSVIISASLNDANEKVIFKTIIPNGHGNFSCQLGIMNGKLVCFVVLTFFQYGIYNLDGSLITINDIPQQYVQTSQGIRFIEGDKIYWGDETLGGVFNGVLIREWIHRSSFTSGQGQEGGMPIVGNRVNYTYNPGGNTLFPRLAVKDNKISILYVNGNFVNWDTLLEKDISSLPVEIDDLMIPSFEKPIWQAPFFSHSLQYGITPLDKHVGNAIWLRTSEKQLNPSVLPLITAVDTNPNDIDVNLTVAYWVSGGNISELVNKVNEALTYPEKPIIAYLDGDGWSDSNPFNSDRVWPAIQAYRFPGESLSAFDNRVGAVINKVQSYGLPLVLTSRFDDFNGSQTIPNILECMPLYDKWLRNYNFVGHMPFSDRRGSGITANQELWKWARAFQFAIPAGRPNRFDYWRPTGMTEKQVLDNKLHQTRPAVVLEKYLRDYILNFNNGSEPLEWPDLLPLVKKVRAFFPEKVTVDQCVAIINEVALLAPAQYQFGLLTKEGGNHGTRSDGAKCSVDWCVSKVLGKGTDCLISTPSSTEGPVTAEAKPTWSDEGEDFNLENWKAPI